MRNAWKCWCFTHYHLNWKWENMMDNPLLQYCVVNLEECPTTGRWHYQGYLELTEERTRDDLMDWLEAPGVHLEPRHKSQTQAIEYCKKSETQIMGPWELGSLTKEQGKRNDIFHVKELIKAGGTMREVIDCTNSAQAMQVADKCIMKYSEQRRFWKTELIICDDRLPEIREAFYVSSNKWMDGYDGHEVVCIHHKYTLNQGVGWDLNDLCGSLPLRVECKHGSREWLCKTLYLYSPFKSPLSGR